MYRTVAEAMAAALARQQAAQCAAGRHSAECEHRRNAPAWVIRAMAKDLPAKVNHNA